MTATGRPLGNVKFTAMLESKLGRDIIPAKTGRPRRSARENRKRFESGTRLDTGPRPA
jgi:hypothetical protein